jgi:murein hydrolase activator
MGVHSSRNWIRASAAGSTLIALAVAAVGAQAPDRAHAEALARRATARMQALHREADALASQERTLLVDLQRLEVERRLRSEQLKKVTADADAVSRDLDATETRIAELEREERTQRPGLEQRLAEVYKLGRGGYLRMLLSVDDLRGMGRAYRTVAAISEIDRARVREHRRTLQELRTAAKDLGERRVKLAGLHKDALRARSAADQAAAARSQLIDRIDQRRDLNAQLAGELQVAQQRLQQALAAMASGRPAVELVALPLGPFQGDLDWPLAGPLVQRFGRDRGRFATTAAQNGIEIGGTEGAPVTAVHDGTVAFADTFAGFGNLVIIDHGSQAFSLYGHLSALDVARNDRIARGQPVGEAGSGPTGQTGLYFELRIDGKPVDPVQWLKKK